MAYDLWNEANNILAEHLSQDTMKRWFANIINVDKIQSTLYIKVYSDMQAEWMDTHYSQLIKESILKLTDEELDIVFISNASNSSNNQLQNNQQEQNNIYRQSSETVYNNTTNNYTNNYNNNYNSKFNPRYNFESFVVGNGNRFAHAAALAVADRPAQSYNPLFLHGGSGLGKTHLMHAIGHRIKYLRPDTNILYISTETFTNEFISSVRQGTAHKFKNRYRNADIFLVDDIQFLTGKEGTQEEFFHTFNALYEQGKQIVISSDRHPKDIATLEERLRSRFEGGLITDIQPPDLETRIAILQYKSNSENLAITDDAISYIANNISSNIRELEGALNRVKYYAIVHSIQVISLDFTQEQLEGILPNKTKKPLSTELIKQTVAEYFHLKVNDLISPRRDQSITKPRHIAMYLCQTMLNSSLSDIGKSFGGRDHTTVLHGCKKVQSDLKNDPNLSKNIDEIIKLINN